MITSLSYPVYKLRKYNSMEEVDKVLHIDTFFNSYILDNKNLKGDTLGQRRLRMNEATLYPLKNKINNPIGFIGQKDSSGTYIDNSGKIFKYKKTLFVPLTYHTITSVDYLEGVGININVFGIDTPIIVNKRYVSEEFVGLLYWLGGYIVYELTNEIKKNTRIKI